VCWTDLSYNRQPEGLWCRKILQPVGMHVVYLISGIPFQSSAFLLLCAIRNIDKQGKLTKYFLCFADLSSLFLAFGSVSKIVFEPARNGIHQSKIHEAIMFSGHETQSFTLEAEDV
jgi:hypothetical protein